MSQELERTYRGNRIASAIAKTADKVAAARKSGKLTDATYRSLSRQLDMEFHEYAEFQALKSDAHANGVLSYEEACLVYGYLGGSWRTFNAQGLAVKTVLNQLFRELLEKRLTMEQLADARQRLAAETAANYVPASLPPRLPKMPSKAKLPTTVESLIKSQGLPKMPTKRK